MICIVGLGYVGLPLAVEFGKTREVVGFDISPQRINELKSGFDRTMECSAEQLGSAHSLKFSTDESDLDRCEVFIVTVPTPIDQSNQPDLGPLEQASRLIGRHLNRGNIVVYESTVFPGATEEICVPILEETSGLEFNSDFFCGYSPERINPGDKVNTLTTIQKIVSGSTPGATDVIDKMYSQIITAGTHRVSSIRVAEAAKVIENAQRDLNIAFVNELSVIFDRLDIDTVEVLEAAGTKWNFLPFRPGMVGGHCIGVDPYYLTHKAESVGYHPQILLAGRRMNDNMARYAARSMIKRMSRRGIDIARSTVGIFGVTFKENCPDIRNSKIFDMIKEFESWGVSVIATDPWADPEEVLRKYGTRVKSDIECRSCDSLVVAVGHTEYRSIQPRTLLDYCKYDGSPVLGDLKALYGKQDCIDVGFDVFRF